VTDPLPDLAASPELAEPKVILAGLNSRFTNKFLRDCEGIRRRATDGKQWRIDAIVALAIRCYHTQAHLKRGYIESDAHYMAWAARTLLELKVWAIYITGSDVNLKRFYQDMYVDINSAFKTGEIAVNALEEHPLKAASQKLLDDCRERLEEGLAGAQLCGSEPYLKVRAIAKQLSLDIEFDIANMTFSKWTHATAQSILLPLYSRGKPDSKYHLFLGMGATNAHLTMDRLSAYIKQNGLRSS